MNKYGNKFDFGSTREIVGEERLLEV